MDTEGVLKKHNIVFKEGIGTIKDFKVKIHVKPDTKLIFWKPYTVRLLLERLLTKNWIDLKDLILSHLLTAVNGHVPLW